MVRSGLFLDGPCQTRVLASLPDLPKMGGEGSIVLVPLMHKRLGMVVQSCFEGSFSGSNILLDWLTFGGNCGLIDHSS